MAGRERSGSVELGGICLYELTSSSTGGKVSRTVQALPSVIDLQEVDCFRVREKPYKD